VTIRSGVDLLRDRRHFRIFWLALTISYLGSGAAATGLTLYVQQSHGSGLAVGALMAALTLPRILGLVTGAIADRLDLRRVMVICDVGQAVAFAFIATLPPFGVLLALVVVTTVLQTTYSPARSSVLPKLVDDSNILTANGVVGIAFNLYPAAGPLIGGLLVTTLGAHWLFALDGVTFILSAALTCRLPSLPSLPTTRQVGLGRSIREGLRYARADRVVTAVVVSLLAMMFFVAIGEVSLVFLVRQTLGGGAGAFGFVVAAFGMGMIASSVLVLRWVLASPSRVYLVGLALMGIATLLTGLAPLIVLVAAVQVVSGVGYGLINTGGDTVIQKSVPPEFVGRMFGLMLAAYALGTGVASMLGGALVDATSPRLAFGAAGVGALLVTVISVLSLSWRGEP
jgi:MFS family permease